MRRSYAVHMAPSAADASQDRLFLAGAGKIHALTLHSGAPVAAVNGSMPVAVNSAQDLLAFVAGNSLVLANAGNLRTVRRVPLPGGTPPTALAWQGSSLLVGSARGMSRILLDDCTL
jgi:hypothetical protein